MANRWCATLVATAATAVFMAHSADGHAHQQFPISRQYAWSRDFHDFGFDNIEGAPYAYNAGGVKDVQKRARDKVSDAVLEQHGGVDGMLFPLYFEPLADNGNFLESNEIAKRHGVCGDPRLGFADSVNTYSTANSNWDVLDENHFTAGQVIEMDIVVVYYHWGHFEFFLCDIGDLGNPDGVPDQECFNKYPLTRAPEAQAASQIDPNYPGRYYVDPECRQTSEVDQNVSDNMPDESYNVKMRYTLPDIDCPHCILQFHYLTGNRCKHIGYDDFNPTSWYSNCAPDTEDWIDTDMGICGEANAYPEEFWGCSDISISGGGSGPSTAPDAPEPTPEPATPEPTPEPVSPAPEPVTPEPTPEPVYSPEPTPEPVTPEPTPEPVYSPEPTPDYEPEPANDDVANDDAANDDGADDYVTPTTGDDEATDYVTPSDDGRTTTGGDGVEYLGCWEDKRGERLMLIGYKTNKEMTNQGCIDYCRDEGAYFAGTESDYSCWCGTEEETIYRHGESDECNQECSGGDGTEICGGHLAVSVYTTGLAPDSENNDVSEPDMDKAPETEAAGAEYLGCFEDSKDNHIMKIGFVDDNMTNEWCLEHCTENHRAFAGVMNGFSCWCTDDEQKIYSLRASDGCDRSCGGDDSEVCGGIGAMTAWSTGVEVVPEPPSIQSATYLGCFEDMRGERTMEIGYVNNHDMTNEECVEYCRMDGKAYAGTQNAYSCWCGNDSDKIARHGESDECTDRCDGDESQICGGLLAVTTWATGLAPDR